MRKKTACGFLLVSMVVYGAITVLLVAATIRLAVLVIPVTYSLISWCSYTPFYTAHDFILREFANAPSDTAHWLKADTEGFIWRAGETTKAILIKKDSLIYKEGIYAQGRWSTSSTSLLAQGCRFTDGHSITHTDRVTELYCRAERIEKPAYAWECRWVLYGET